MVKSYWIQKASDYFGENGDIVNLEYCAHGGYNCKKIRERINSLLLDARIQIEDRNFARALEEMKEAFLETVTLEDKRCTGCGKFFRLVINSSVNSTVFELEEMTKGWFRKKRYLAELERARIVHKEMSEYISLNDL